MAPHREVREAPVADGGEGTVDAVLVAGLGVLPAGRLRRVGRTVATTPGQARTTI